LLNQSAIMLFLGRLRTLYAMCGLGLVSLGVLLALLLLLSRTLHTTAQPDTASADQMAPAVVETAEETATPFTSYVAMKLSEERIAALRAALEARGELSMLQPIDDSDVDLLSSPLDELDELSQGERLEALLVGLNVDGDQELTLAALDTGTAFMGVPRSAARSVAASSMGGGGGSAGSSGASGAGSPDVAASSPAPNGSGGLNPPQPPGESTTPNDSGPEGDEPPYEGPPTVTEQPPTGGDPNQPVSVPEPTTIALMGIGLSGVLAMARSTRQRRERVSE
jgi:hypothetical protein